MGGIITRQKDLPAQMRLGKSKSDASQRKAPSIEVKNPSVHRRNPTDEGALRSPSRVAKPLPPPQVEVSVKSVEPKAQSHVKMTPVEEFKPSTSGAKTEPEKSVWIIRPTDDINSMFSFGQKLGEGRFGVTHVAQNKQSGKQFACKSVSKKKLNSPQEIKDLRYEIEVMHHLVGYDGVVQLNSAYEDPGYVHLVMELCGGGDLFHAITSKHHYSEKDAASMMRTILQALGYCHTMGVLHRDLKPENFLLSENGPNAKIKIADFGLSTFFKEGELFNDVVGSPYYIAPEVLRRKYSKEADIWSCGVILYILLCGSPPFYGKDEREIFKAVLEKTPDTTSGHWARISAGAKDCLSRMLVRDPLRRGTIAELLQHKWLVPNGTAPDEPLNLELVHRMKRFARMNSLKKRALQIIVDMLPKEETAGLQQFFDQLDLDKNGFVTHDELRAGLESKGSRLPPAELQKLMQYADMDGDGQLDYREFLSATIHTSKITASDDLMLKAFKFFDKDGSGFITRDELQLALAGGGFDISHMDVVLMEIDKDADGKIDFAEFSHMLRTTDSGDYTLKVLNAGIGEETRSKSARTRSVSFAGNVA